MWTAIRGAAALTAACGGMGCGGPPDPFRPYDSAVTCPGPYMEVLDVDDAIARVDVDGDGLLTPDDLLPGEAVFVLRVTGTHADLQQEAHPGVSIHVDWGPTIERSGSERVFHATADCMPTARLALSFAASDVGPGEPYESDLTGFDFRVVDLEVATNGEKSTDGGVVGYAGEGTLSGVLDGSASGALHSEAPERYRRKYHLSEITGETIHVEALAFRDVEVRP